MKTFLHIGLHKTGTTYLQKQVFPRIPGITYIGRPYTQDNFVFNTLQYADDTLFDPKCLDLEMSTINRYASGGAAVLISDENLCGFPFYNYINREMIARRLARVVPDAEVIVFLRNQFQLIHSLYNQYVKINWYSDALDGRFLSAPGTGASLQDWLQGDLALRADTRYIQNQAKFNVEHLRYSRLLDLYQKYFARVHVFLYEDFKDDNVVLLRALSEVLGVEIPSVSGHGSKNQSLSERQLHRRLVLNRLTRISSRFESPLGLVVARALSPLFPKNAPNDRAHVNSILRSADIAEDNKSVDEIWKCGMSRHAPLYFSNQAEYQPSLSGDDSS